MKWVTPLQELAQCVRCKIRPLGGLQTPSCHLIEPPVMTAGRLHPEVVTWTGACPLFNSLGSREPRSLSGAIWVRIWRS